MEVHAFHLNDEFKQIIDRFPFLLDQLINSDLIPRNKLGRLPQNGIYVFFENGRALYVGRTNRGRMKDRILVHGRRGSRHNSASFAFNLAKKTAREKGIAVSERRKKLEQDPTFRGLFIQAKERISRMSARVIEIQDVKTQYLFEVYAAIALETEFNDFDTH